MRLKLNKTLRAALIAAITTVGCTLTQAQASDYPGEAVLGDWFYTHSQAHEYLEGSDVDTINLTAEETGVNASITTVTAKAGGTLRIVGGNTWGGNRSFADLQIDTLKAGSDGAGEVFINTQQYSDSYNPNGANATIKAVQGTLSGVANYAFLTLGTEEGGTISASGTLENKRNDSTLTLNGAYTFDTTNAAGYTVKQEGKVVWSDTEHSQGFKTSTGASYYLTKGATEGAGFSATITGGTTAEKDEAGNYYFIGGEVTDYSKFYVKAATATLENVDATGQIIVEEGGQGGTLTVKNAKYRDTSGSKNLNIIVDDQGVLEVTHSGSNGYVTGDITIKRGGTFRVAGQHDAFGWGGGTTKNIILQGEDGKIATLDLQQTTGNSVTMNAALKLMGYAAVTGAKGFNTHDGSFYAEGVQNTIESFQIRHDATFEVKEGGELTVGTMTKGNDGNKVLTKTGKGTMTFTAKAQAEGLVINEGSIVITGGTENSFNALSIAADGALTVTGGTTTVSGTSNVLSNTISVTGGTLTLNGTYEIGGNTGEMTTTYEGGEVDGNGFAHIAGSSKVYTTAAGATVDVANAHFTVGGKEVTLENGVYTTAGSTNYGTFYVKNGEENLSTAIEYASKASQTVSAVSLADDTTINADQSATFGLVLAEGTGHATVNATAATTISGVSGWSGRALTITGGAAVSLIPGQTIVIGEGSTLTVDATVNAQKVQLNGTDASLVVTDSGTLTTSNNLTLTKGKADIYGTVNVGHEVDLSDGNKATGTLHIHGGGDVTVKDGMWMSPNAAGVLLDEDATFAITGKGVLFAGKEGGNGSIKASGAEVNYSTTNASAAISNVTMTATADITIGNTLNNVDVVTGEHGVTLNAAANDVTVSTDGSISIGATGSAATITVEDGGIIGSYTKANAGETAVTSEDTAILADVIDLQAGKLTMTGKYNIDYLYGEVEISGYEGGVDDHNGFAHETGTIQVVDIAEDATLDATEGTFIRGGNELQLTDGTAEVDATNYGTFYVNTASETVTQAKSMETEHGPLSFIYVEEGATLVVNEDINGSLVDTWSSGTVNIQKGKTVTGTMEGVSLSGAGTYDLGSGVSTLGEGTSLGEDWAGIVRISNVTKNNIDLAPFVNGTLSTVELKGFSGWTGNNLWKGLNPQNIKLTNTEDGGVAWYSNAYSSSKTDTAVYSGKWSGEGTYVTDVNAARYLNHTYSGDVSDWTGVFEKRGDGTSILTFIDNAEEVNVEIKRTAGTLNLVVGNGEDEFATVFNGEVTASSITVNEQASAEFNELHITSAIQNSGAVTLNCDMEVTGFDETSGESGYYDLNKQFSTNGNGYAGTSDSYLTIVDGGTVVADSITVTQGDDTYTMNNSGLALKGDRTVDYDKFYVNDGTVSYAAVAGDGHGARFIEVTGGTLDVDTTPDALTITVTGEGTLTGDELDVTRVHIDEQAIVHVTDGLVSEGVTFYAAEGGDVSITNTGRKRAYSTENGEMLVQAGGIVKTTEKADDNVTVSNILEVGEITNTQGGTLTLDGVSEAIEVKNLIIGLAENPAATVEMLVSGSTDEATVTITEALAAGNGTLLANLVMADDSALLVGGVEKALHVGSTLTMGTNIALDGLTLQALDDLAIGEDFWLVDKAAGRELFYTGATGEDAWYDAVFSRVSYEGDYTLEGDFNIVFDEETDSLGLRKFSNTPEPTTGTLSLLALAALAARRRRH